MTEHDEWNFGLGAKYGKIDNRGGLNPYRALDEDWSNFRKAVWGVIDYAHWLEYQRGYLSKNPR